MSVPSEVRRISIEAGSLSSSAWTTKSFCPFGCRAIDS